MVYICITLILIVILIENYVQIKKNCHITSLHSYPATSTWLHYLTYIVTLPPVHSYPTTSTWLHYLTYIVTLSPPHSHTTLLEWSHYLNHVVALSHCIVTSSILLLSKSENYKQLDRLNLDTI